MFEENKVSIHSDQDECEGVAFELFHLMQERT